MENENKANQIADAVDDSELLRRRDFLQGLKKWSQAVISGVVMGALVPTPDASAWVNSRGSWVNGAGVGGWANRGATWINGGGGWINNRVGGGAWVNRRGW